MLLAPRNFDTRRIKSGQDAKTLSAEMLRPISIVAEQLSRVYEKFGRADLHSVPISQR
jgi:hypothetical protein